MEKCVLKALPLLAKTCYNAARESHPCLKGLGLERTEFEKADRE